MGIIDTVGQAQDSMTVRRVFGEPYEKDGAVIITAAAVRGGGGGGSGHGTGPQGDGGEGEGGGFGLSARPVGAFVFRDGQAEWVPVVDTARTTQGAFAVALAFLFVAWRVLRVVVRS